MKVSVFKVLLAVIVTFSAHVAFALSLIGPYPVGMVEAHASDVYFYNDAGYENAEGVFRSALDPF